MKTAVTQTSLHSYDALKASGFKGQHSAICSRMERGKVYSRRQVAKVCGLETSTVAARVNDLVKFGQVVEVGTIKCPITGKHVGAIKLADAQGELLQ